MMHHLSHKETMHMQRILAAAAITLGTLSLAGALLGISVQASSHAENAFTPDAIHWGPPPPFVPAGAQLAVLEGNPGAASGDYTIRLRMPDGYKIAPHWHPLRENVTIIKGNLKVGMGDVFEADKMATFAAGSFAYLDPDMHHYVMAAGGETIVQVHGAAPLQFNYINPKDDPSKK
jgi:hypothetical protein